MTLEQTYKEYILEKLLKTYLEDGEIPTSDTLEDDLEEYQEVHLDLTLPKSKYIDFSVERGDNSSAGSIQEIAEVVSSDVGVVTRELYSVVQQSNLFYERWSYEIQRLTAKAKKLEREIDSLLLLTNNTAGYFAAVGDVFSDMNLIDTENTTAAVNLHEASVILNSGTSTFSSTKQIDTTGVSETDVSFSVLSKRPGTTYAPPNEANALQNIFKTVSSSWVGKVSSKVSGEMICELKAYLSKDKDLEVSKIVLEYTGSDTTSRSTITAQYSVDGYTWHLVPTTEATKAITRHLSWKFSLTNLRWIKFIIRKPNSDNGEYNYDFSIRSIKLYGNIYAQDRGNVFISNSLYAIDSQENPVGFSMVQLDVCEDLPGDKNTDILYYVSASKDETTWTDWLPILPAERNEIKYPKVINFSGIDWKDNTVFEDTTVLSSLITGAPTQMKLTGTFDASGVVGYRFKNSQFGAINTQIALSANEDPDSVARSAVLWRNIRYKTTYPDLYTVRNTPRGWGLAGQVYSCYFEIVNSEGRLFNFGDRKCIIDDQEVVGVVTIPAGIHKFSTDADNWFDISSAITALGTSTVIINEETLRSLDPLYPYNHKLLIEGFPYKTGFVGEKIYLGTDTSAEFYAKKISLFDLENNINTLGYFAVRSIGSSTSPSIAAIVRYNPNNSDYVNELCILKWRSGETEANLNKYIKLKAELETDSSSYSPSFSSYRLKLGI